MKINQSILITVEESCLFLLFEASICKGLSSFFLGPETISLIGFQK